MATTRARRTSSDCGGPPEEVAGGRLQSNIKSEVRARPTSRTKYRGRVCWRQRSGPRQQLRSVREVRPHVEHQGSAKVPAELRNFLVLVVVVSRGIMALMRRAWKEFGGGAGICIEEQSAEKADVDGCRNWSRRKQETKGSEVSKMR